MIKILAIESSCDETAISVICNDNDPAKRILSNIVYSQFDEHRDYGGVVPELASRAHILHIRDIAQKALQEAKITLRNLDVIAVTQGPGLVGGLAIGIMFAKGISSSSGLPLIGINHLEGHALTARLTDNVEFPYLLFLISGGHCQIILVKSLGNYELLAQTIDDAMGEAFDKVAKMLGLGYPGGPAVEKMAMNGDANCFSLPHPLSDRKDSLDLSFSGLKTAVYYEIKKFNKKNDSISDHEKQKFICDICASFQKTCAEILADRLKRSLNIARKSEPNLHSIVLAGGVAANQYIREYLQGIAEAENGTLICPPPSLCTDNAAMIGWAAIEYVKSNGVEKHNNQPEVVPRIRWPLSESSAI